MAARRPGMELVISAHKSVAELGVIGRAEHMHLIMDAERDATLDYLDQVTRQVGGRRGRIGHRDGDRRAGLRPHPPRHVPGRRPVPARSCAAGQRGRRCRMAGAGGRRRTPRLWREHLHAATMVGRVAAARVAVELGYAIEADPGPSGRLRHWRIAGVPDEVIEVHSKRAAEIDAECERRGEHSSRARAVAARTTRKAKQHGGRGRAGGPLAGRVGVDRMAGRAAHRSHRQRRPASSGRPPS